MLRAFCTHTVSASAARSFPIVTSSVSFAYSGYYPAFISLAHTKAPTKSVMKKAAGSGSGKVQKSIMAFCNVKDSDNAAAKGKGGKSQQSILTFMKPKNPSSDPTVNEATEAAGNIPATPPERVSRALAASSALSPSPAVNQQADVAQKYSPRKRSPKRTTDSADGGVTEQTESVTVGKDSSVQGEAGGSGNGTENERALDSGAKKSSPRKRRSPKGVAADAEQPSEGEGADVVDVKAPDASTQAGREEGAELLSTTAVGAAKKPSPRKRSLQSAASASVTEAAAGEAGGAAVAASRKDTAAEGTGPAEAVEKLRDVKEGDSSEGEEVEVVTKPRLKRLRKVRDTKEGAIKEGGEEGEGAAAASTVKRGRRKKVAMVTDSDDEGSQLAGKDAETGRMGADVAMKDAGVAVRDASAVDVAGVESRQVAPDVTEVSAADVSGRENESAPAPAVKASLGTRGLRKGRQAAAPVAADVAGAPKLLEDEGMRDAREMSGSEGAVSDNSDGSSDSSEVSSGKEEEGEDEVVDGEKEKTIFSELGKRPRKSKTARKAKGKKNAPGVGDGLAALAEKHADYDPIAAATWEVGEKVPFLYLAEAMDKISNESGRLAITEIMTNVFRTVMATSPQDLLPIVYLAANRVAPPHEGVELGIGDAAIIKALAEATGRKEAMVKSEYKEYGDLGLVAKASRNSQRRMGFLQPLTCAKVFGSFQAIAKESGNLSQEKKRGIIKSLLVAARDCEPQYIVRLLQGKMRIGLAEQTVLAALAQASVLEEDRQAASGQAENRSGVNGDGTEKSVGMEGKDGSGGKETGEEEKGEEERQNGEEATERREEERGKMEEEKQAAMTARQRVASLPQRLEEAVRILKHSYSVLPVYDKIVPEILSSGVWNLPERCRFTLGVPVGPMLAKPTRGISEVLDKLQGLTFICEYKYDGERTQIHGLEDGTVEIYSRNAEKTTVKFPDLVHAVVKHKKPDVKSFVLDAEAVAYDRERDCILPFQVLSTRARKGVIMSDIKVQVCLFAFDLLYLNGEQLLTQTLERRRELLLDSFEPAKGELQFSTAVVTSDVDELQTFLNDAVNHSCEGCMVKTLEQEATYEPAKRSNNWLKLKKDYMEGIGDSLDLVPIGAFHGRGKRAGVFGAFLLACYDPDTEEYQSICKIGTGFSEVMLEERSRTLRNHVLDKPLAYYRFGDSLAADVWFSPAEVWEVKAADLSISPVHKAAVGHVNEAKGVGLRFPRFLRLRDDKAPEQATSAEQVAQMYRSQKSTSNAAREDEE